MLENILIRINDIQVQKWWIGQAMSSCVIFSFCCILNNVGQDEEMNNFLAGKGERFASYAILLVFDRSRHTAGQAQRN